MADERLTLNIEQLAEAVRTAMTREDADEPLAQLADLVVQETEGNLAEVTGQVFRSLLPAFVMTDADFKTPASLSAPTRAMYAVKEACVDWVIELGAVKIPAICESFSIDRTEYRRRMRMSVGEQEEDNEDEDEEEEEGDEENTPPNDEEIEGEKKMKKINQQKARVLLDPVVALLQRLAVRCPDKAEWRKSACDSLLRICEKNKKVAQRFVDNFLINLMVSDKSAWRGFACEAAVGLVRCVELETARRVNTALLSRCSDSVSSVRAKALACISDFSEEAVHILKVRCKDEKPSVRRAAVSLFDQLVSVAGTASVPLGVIADLAKDESLMVRKASIGSVLALIDSCPSLYVETVLPMISDVETSVVEKVVESFEKAFVSIIQNLSKKIETDVSLVDPDFVRLVTAIGSSKESAEYARRCVRVVVRKSDSKQNRIFVKNLELLIAGFLASPQAADELRVVIKVLLGLLEEVSQLLPQLVTRDRIAAGFFPILMTLRFGEEALIECLKILSTGAGGGDAIVESLFGFLKTPQKCALNLLHFAVRCLFHHLPDKQRAQFSDPLSDAAISEIESLIASPQDSFTSGVWHVAILGELAGVGFLPSVKALTAIEAIATNRVYLNGTEHASLGCSLRATAMVAFGRICLQKESIAKRAVSKFAAHLSKEEHPVVRNNVLIVLGDLCVVYTGLVDQYLPWLTTCLSDPNDLIRLQAAVVVSSLLAEDYIKFKGQIVFRLLFLLSDPNEKIKAFVESVFSRILFLRHSGSLKTLFAETVCALNGYLRHPAYQGAAGNKDFLLSANPKRRREIYSFMLTNVITTEQKFNATAQLANSLLSAFVDEDTTNGAVFIPDREETPAGQVLIDTLFLLSHAGLKFSSCGATQTQSEEPEEGKESREKKLFDSVLQKKTVVENLAPLLIQLNSICEQRRSPISRYVRDCLRELVKDYKDEVASIVHSDAQLAQELLYDLGGPTTAASVDEIVTPTAPHEENSETEIDQTACAPKVVAEEEDVDPPESRAKRSKKKITEPMIEVKKEEEPSEERRSTRKRRNL